MTTSKTLLIVFHAPSENTLRMRQAMEAAIKAQTLEQTCVKCLGPLDTQAEDVLNADAVILGTTENLGYMSGALKDFFDRTYYPCIERKQGMPVAAVIRAGQDGTGTRRALESILTGLKWRWVQAPLICKGPWQEGFIEQCEELASAMAVGLDCGML